MTTKKKTQADRKSDPNKLVVTEEPGKSKQRKLAEIQLSPDISNAVTVQSYLKSLAGEVDFTEAVEVMREKSDKIIGGDLSEIESTLTGQIVSLNAIFTNMARRSASCDLLCQLESFMRLALKAQSQCARTAEILATIKNPPIVYAKQANIAQGHQQVNNGVTTHAGKTKKSQNELLTEADNAPLDTRGTPKTSCINQKMETVGAINGSEDTRR